MQREKHLVGSNHAAFRVERPLHIRTRGVDPTHDVDDHVDGGVTEHRLGIRRQETAVQSRYTLLSRITHEHARHLERTAPPLPPSAAPLVPTPHPPPPTSPP